jgi:hypothetical protein
MVEYAMCHVSPRLKLCSCASGDVSRLAHYWVFYRFDPQKNERIIGRVAKPDALDPRAEAYNRATLLKRLNEPDVFDLDLKPKSGDRLQITFRCTEADAPGKARAKTITYGYAFTGEGWVEEPYNSLSWRWHHTNSAIGELRPAPAAPRASSR